MDYFLDTETTGVGDADAVIEVSLLDEKGTDHLTTLVQPLAPIRDSARNTHGLDEEALSGAPPFETVAPRLCRLLSDEYVHNLWAYNADFDRQLLIQTAELAGLPEATAAFKECGWRDLMEPTASYLEVEDWLSLSEAADRLEIDFPTEDLHRAQADAELARRVWVRLVEDGHL